MYLSLNLPALELENIKWHSDKIINKSSNPTLNVNGRLWYWACAVEEKTTTQLQKIFPEEIIENSRVLVQFLRSDGSDNPHKDSYPWTFMYILDDAGGHTNLYNDNKNVIASHNTAKGKWALLRSWAWHSPAGIMKDKIRKALVLRVKKDYDLNFLTNFSKEIKYVA